MTPASFPVGNGSVATSTCLIRNYPSVYFGGAALSLLLSL